MAATDVDIWIPEEWNGPVIQKVNQTSAIEKLARREPMGTDTLHVPRSGDFGVAAINLSGVYSEDTSLVGQITLKARKIGKAMRVAEEQKADAAKLIDVIATKKLDWARNYAKYLDNATLAVTAAENNDMTQGAPFTSLYRALKVGVVGSDYTDVSYTAAANVLTAVQADFTTGSSPTNLGYSKINALLALIEEGDYFDEGEIVVVAHPKFKTLLRGLIGSDGHPVLVDTPDLSVVPTLGGYPITWSLGARTSATATATPNGAVAVNHPLCFLFNRQVATVLGVRSGPESFAASAASGGAGFLTDEDLIKMRSRRGFAVGDPNGAAVLEITA